MRTLHEILGDSPLLIGVRRSRIWVQETVWTGSQWEGKEKITKPIYPDNGTDSETWQTYSIVATWITDSLSTLFPSTSWVVSSFDRLAIAPPETVTLATLSAPCVSSKAQLETINLFAKEPIIFRLQKSKGWEYWTSVQEFGLLHRYQEPASDPTDISPGEQKIPVLKKRFSKKTSMWEEQDAK